LRKKTSLARLLAFAALTATASLWVGNELIEWLERRGTIDTQIQGEQVQSVDEAVFETKGPWYQTSTYGEGSLTSSRFARDKGERWRMFVLGGSFAMGTPYVNGEVPQSGSEGGISSWIQADLGARFPGQIEIVNAAAGGQDSRRVLEIGAEVMRLDPDVLLIAMGNNEGNLGEDQVRQQLRKLGGYRLLRKILLGSAQTPGSWFTPQDVDSEQLRLGFERRLRKFLERAALAQVPVLLAAMPINLGYLGFEPGKLLQGQDWPPLGGDCEVGIRTFEAQRFTESIEALRSCKAGPSSQQPPPLGSYLALAKLESGAGLNKQDQLALRDSHGDCVSKGIESYYSGFYQRSIEELQRCDEVAHALSWIGRARRKAGDLEGARNALQQACELLPHNRTRPSLNQIVRKLSDELDHVHLVDLEAAANRLAAELGDGIPDSEQFLDYCHMNWRGYAAMADEVLLRLKQLGVGPPGKELGLPPSQEQLRELFKLPALQ
tara:strand:+ start:705 stop:2180 length:1476 start_codon:yes stop_codon:yes gene_type:complete